LQADSKLDAEHRADSQKKLKEKCLRNFTKVDCSVELEDFETHFHLVNYSRLVKFHEAPHIVGQQYGVPHGILQVFITLFTQCLLRISQFLLRTSQSMLGGGGVLNSLKSLNLTNAMAI
jgi:hypothetical protein